MQFYLEIWNCNNKACCCHYYRKQIDVAETHHSFSDTLNQILLLIGIRTSKKKVSERHPFGYGKEMFFWSFVVSILIFGISGFISLDRGIASLINPYLYQIENISINYIILAISFVFEANA